MKNIVLLMLLAMSLSAGAQTNIYDKQEVSGTWSKKGSPYIIQGEAIVPEGKTLTIKKGVVVKFKTGYNRDYDQSSFDVGFLRVNGTLTAKGKASAPIQFLANGTGFWGCVYVNNAKSTCNFSYCIFEGGYYVRQIIYNDNATGVLTFNNSGGTVKNCVFAKNGWNGINCKNGSAPHINHVSIIMCNYAMECNTASNPVVENSLFYGNDNLFYVNGNSKPSLSYCCFDDYELPYFVSDGGNNIFKDDPGLVDYFSSDYHLTPSSPCLKKGKDKKNIGAY